MVSKCPSRENHSRSYKSAAGVVSIEGPHHTYTLHEFRKGLSDPCLRPSWYLGITKYELRSELAKDGHWLGVLGDTWARGQGGKRAGGQKFPPPCGGKDEAGPGASSALDLLCDLRPALSFRPVFPPLNGVECL